MEEEEKVEEEEERERVRSEKGGVEGVWEEEEGRESWRRRKGGRVSGRKGRWEERVGGVPWDPGSERKVKNDQWGQIDNVEVNNLEACEDVWYLDDSNWLA